MQQHTLVVEMADDEELLKREREGDPARQAAEAPEHEQDEEERVIRAVSRIPLMY